jgi:transposase
MKVLFWGAIGFDFKSNLHFVNGTIDTDKYCFDIVPGSSFLQDADHVFGAGNWAIMQDNALPRESNDAFQNLDSMGIPFIEDWPPDSPDLNPIEILWAVISREVEKQLPPTKFALINLVQTIWLKVPQATINALIDSFPKHLQQVQANGGEQIHF